MEKLKVLITGGSWFLGINLHRFFLAKVHALVSYAAGGRMRTCFCASSTEA